MVLALLVRGWTCAGWGVGREGREGREGLEEGREGLALHRHVRASRRPPVAKLCHRPKAMSYRRQVTG